MVIPLSLQSYARSNSSASLPISSLPPEKRTVTLLMGPSSRHSTTLADLAFQIHLAFPKRHLGNELHPIANFEAVVG
jgi:hypothetical protein